MHFYAVPHLGHVRELRSVLCKYPPDVVRDQHQHAFGLERMAAPQSMHDNATGNQSRRMAAVVLTRRYETNSPTTRFAWRVIFAFARPRLNFEKLW